MRDLETIVRENATPISAREASFQRVRQAAKSNLSLRLTGYSDYWRRQWSKRAEERRRANHA